MKKLLIASLAFAALGTSTSAFAQAAGPVGGAPKSPGGPAMGAHMTPKEREAMNESILAKLNLTEDQKAKIAAHKTEMEGKVKALREQAKADRKAGKMGEAREQLKALEKENREFMKQTLTKDQMKEYLRLRKEAIKEMESKNGVGAPKP